MNNKIYETKFCNESITCIDIARHLPFDLANAFKYIWRAGNKPENDFDSEIKKAIDYVDDWKNMMLTYGAEYCDNMLSGLPSALSVFSKLYVKNENISDVFEIARLVVLFHILKCRDIDGFERLFHCINEFKDIYHQRR